MKEDELRELIESKMAPQHVDLFQRMAGVELLPEVLVDKYHEFKMLADKVDARVTPDTLVFILLAAGFDPQTMAFQQEIVDDDSAACSGIDGNAKDPEKTDEVDDAKGEAENQAEDPPIEMPEGATFKLGQEVETFHDSDPVTGKIVGASDGEDGIVYEIEVEGIEGNVITPESEVFKKD